MTNETTLATVREFFRTVDYVGLILPNGWFGRPHDNMLWLTRAEASQSKLVLVLNEDLILTFSGEPHVARADDGLRISGFSALDWDWTGAGSRVSHHKTYVAGEVKLVAGPFGLA